MLILPAIRVAYTRNCHPKTYHRRLDLLLSTRQWNSSCWDCFFSMKSDTWRLPLICVYVKKVLTLKSYTDGEFIICKSKMLQIWNLISRKSTDFGWWAVVRMLRKWKCYITLTSDYMHWLYVKHECCVHNWVPSLKYVYAKVPQALNTSGPRNFW